MKEVPTKKAAKKTTPRRRTTKSAATSDSVKPSQVDLTAARAFAAAHLPGAGVNAKFGNASFFIEGKVFAFTRPRGLVLKLPPDTLAKTLATRDAEPLTMGKRVMREWILLHHATPDHYREEPELLRAAMAYVRSAIQL